MLPYNINVYKLMVGHAPSLLIRFVMLFTLPTVYCVMLSA